MLCLLEKVQSELKMTGQELANCKDPMPSSLLRNAVHRDLAAESEHDAALAMLGSTGHCRAALLADVADGPPVAAALPFAGGIVSGG